MASRKCINIYIPKYFLAVRNCIYICTPKYFCTSRGSLYGMNSSSIISQRFNWSEGLQKYRVTKHTLNGLRRWAPAQGRDTFQVKISGTYYGYLSQSKDEGK